MILQALNDLYDRLENDDSYGMDFPGVSSQKISFCVILEEDGELYDINDERKTNEKGKKYPDQVKVLGEAKPSGSGINPCFLWDNQTYLLGRQPEDKKAGFGEERFKAFRDRHLALEKEINCLEFSLVCRFLGKWDLSRIAEFSEKLNEVGPGFGVFKIRGQKKYIHEASGISKWWKENRHQEPSKVLGQCLITGETNVPIARLHPKIKGIAGAQSAGASIVSFNDTAYDSYAKSQSYNSPVSEDASFRYGAALNAILTGPKSKRHRLRIGDTTCIFWTEVRSDVESVFGDAFGGGSNATEEVQDETQRARLERFFKALRQGEGFTDDQAPMSTPFYILGLAPNAARLSIRFFYRSTIAELLERLRSHQRCLSMVREFEEPKGKRYADPEFPATWQLLGQTARVSDEVPPLLGGALIRAIVQGSNYPEGLFSAVLRRIRADRTINYLRAALLKAVLVRNHNETNIQTMLDTSENADPAYKLGRLFAALEKTQEEAQPGINATIRDRFYSAASATPASVFPRLLRTYQHHLSKLNQGSKINRERLVQEIFSSADSQGLPSQLGLKAQGLFAIGYYHQRKDLFTKKSEIKTQTENKPTKAHDE